VLDSLPSDWESRCTRDLEYYSSQKWGDVDSYDFCLDSSVFGLDGTVEIIEQLAARKEARLGA
jgi:hypothetical protein